MTMSSIIG